MAFCFLEPEHVCGSGYQGGALLLRDKGRTKLSLFLPSAPFRFCQCCLFYNVSDNLLMLTIDLYYMRLRDLRIHRTKIVCVEALRSVLSLFCQHIPSYLLQSTRRWTFWCWGWIHCYNKRPGDLKKEGLWEIYLLEHSEPLPTNGPLQSRFMPLSSNCNGCYTWI